MEQLKQDHNPFLNLSPGYIAEIELISACFRKKKKQRTTFYSKAYEI